MIEAAFKSFVRSGRGVVWLLQPRIPSGMMSGGIVREFNPRSSSLAADIQSWLQESASAPPSDAQANEIGVARIRELLGDKALSETASLKTWVLIWVQVVDGQVSLMSTRPARRVRDRGTVAEQLPLGATPEAVADAYRRFVIDGEAYLAEQGYRDAPRTFA